MSSWKDFSAALSRTRTPVFLARCSDDAPRPKLTVHTAERGARRVVMTSVRSALDRCGIEADVAVVHHSAAALRRQRSLEALNRRFGTGRIVFDPTQVATRTAMVLDCASRLRAELNGRLDGLYLDTVRRALYVVLNKNHYSSESQAVVLERLQTLKIVSDAVKAWKNDEAPDFDLALRLGFGVPADLNLVSVDSKTTATTVRRLVNRRSAKRLAKLAMAAVYGLNVAVPAFADEPTLSGPSAQLRAHGGWLQGDDLGDGGWGFLGLNTNLPLGQLLGFKGEIGVGTDEYRGASGHVFHQDPNWGLVGAFATFETMNGIDWQRLGAEARAYLESVTLSGKVGYQSGDIDDSLFAGLDISFFATDNFMIRGGAEFSDARSFGHLGFEWQPAMGSMPGLSVFGDTEFGEDDYWKAVAGFRMHFGADSDASLKQRHRRNSPENDIPHHFGDDDDEEDVKKDPYEAER